jgi:hypothetical protein
MAIAWGREDLLALPKRLASHAAGFAAYAGLAAAFFVVPSWAVGFVALAALATHAFWDERGRPDDESIPLTKEQKKRWELLMGLLRARESDDGTLSLNVNSILPMSDDRRLPDNFALAVRAELRRAVRQRAVPTANLISRAIRTRSSGPILVFIRKGEMDGLLLVNQALREAEESRNGETRPVLISIDPDVPNRADLATEINYLRSTARVPTALVQLGKEVESRKDGYHYEDLFAAFARDEQLANDRAVLAMLEELAKGGTTGVGGIVQIGASAQAFRGNEKLLALILLVLPTVANTGVILDFKALLATANQA